MLSALKKNPASKSTCGGCRLPLLARDRVGIEDRPDRAAAVVAVADAGERGVDEIARIVFDVLGVEIGVRLVRIDALVGVVAEVAGGLVVEALAQHVDQDDVLPVRHRKSDGARLVENFAARMPAHIDVAVLAADRARLGDAGAELAGDS